MRFRGRIVCGSGDASRTWDWQGICKKIDDPRIHHGTINVKLNDYSAYTFSSDINYSEHVKPCGFAEGLRFQRCSLRVGNEKLLDAFVVKTDPDFWAQSGVLEIIAPKARISTGDEVEIVVPDGPD